MSGWVPSYFGGGGRWSPFGRAPPPRTPDVRDSDYAYISQDDIVDPPSGYQGQGNYYTSQGGAGYARRREPSDDDPNAPDILIVKYKGQFHHLPFAAYSISEGRLSIGEIRRAAAQKLGVRESHRVKLLYKSRQLKDDAEAAGEEGLKQNSEITCVISEKTDDLSSSDDESPSEREMDQDRIEYQNGGRRGNESGARRTGRRQGKGKGKGKRDKGTSVSSPPYDNQQEYFPKAPQDGRDNRLDPTRSSSSTPNRRPSPIPPAPSPSVFDASLPASKPEPLAFKQIADLEKKLRTELAPPTEALLSDPPSDAKKRDYEVIRLTETIERDIVIKTDAIDTEGRDDIRQKRKKLINEANSMLQRLDTAKKRWKGES